MIQEYCSGYFNELLMIFDWQRKFVVALEPSEVFYALSTLQQTDDELIDRMGISGGHGS